LHSLYFTFILNVPFSNTKSRFHCMFYSSTFLIHFQINKAAPYTYCYFVNFSICYCPTISSHSHISKSSFKKTINPNLSLLLFTFHIHTSCLKSPLLEHCTCACFKVFLSKYFLKVSYFENNLNILLLLLSAILYDILY
jgi:hypothetical protein